MQTGTKITLRFNLIVSVILIAYACSIYYFFSRYANDEFYTRLKEEAITTARLYSEIEEVTYDLLKKIDQNAANVLPHEKVLIYDLGNHLLYSSMEIDVDEIDHRYLDRLKTSQELMWQEGVSDFYGIRFKGKFQELLVVASAWDQYGHQKLTFLRYLLVVAVVIAIVITTGFGFLFARQALQPIAAVVRQVDRITASNLNLRVNEGNGRDEIAQLAIKFNKMLERLEAAFEMQKSFVANASHELRTPLTALTGEIEVALMKAGPGDEAKALLRSLLDDIRELNKLSNGLLELAHADTDISEIRLEPVRIDEIIGAARAELLRTNHTYTVNVHIPEFPDDEKHLKTLANEQLMRSALTNVIENACKYSNNKTATVSITFTHTHIQVEITDQGMGIPEESLPHVFEPFYRAPAVRAIKGHGVGLALTKKVLLLHEADIRMASSPQGTTVFITIPHL